MSNLSIETTRTGDISVMKLKGRADSDASLELDIALSQLLSINRNKIVLDLHGVDFLSSAGLRAMVKALKEARSLGGDVRLAATSGPVEVILRTVGMLQMFKMFSTSEEAAADF